jgi:hypothetical protein
MILFLLIVPNFSYAYTLSKTCQVKKETIKAEGDDSPAEYFKVDTGDAKEKVAPLKCLVNEVSDVKSNLQGQLKNGQLFTDDAIGKTQIQLWGLLAPKNTDFYLRDCSQIHNNDVTFKIVRGDVRAQTKKPFDTLTLLAFAYAPTQDKAFIKSFLNYRPKEASADEKTVQQTNDCRVANVCDTNKDGRPDAVVVCDKSASAVGYLVEFLDKGIQMSEIGAFRL